VILGSIHVPSPIATLTKSGRLVRSCNIHILIWVFICIYEQCTEYCRRTIPEFAERTFHHATACDCVRGNGTFEEFRSELTTTRIYSKEKLNFLQESFLLQRNSETYSCQITSLVQKIQPKAALMNETDVLY